MKSGRGKCDLLEAITVGSKRRRSERIRRRLIYTLSWRLLSLKKWCFSNGEEFARQGIAARWLAVKLLENDAEGQYCR